METQLKICGVCGDKALGYNFNALTCESCKAFFRRNALRTKKFHCISSTNKCHLDSKTRKYCRKCRLDKCFAIGMRKEWILTDEEKQMKRRKHRQIKMNDADSSTQANQQKSSNDINHSSNDCFNHSNRIKLNSSGPNNIIILPILSTSSILQSRLTESGSSQSLKSIDQKRLIDFINQRLEALYQSEDFTSDTLNHNENNIIFLNEFSPSNESQQQQPQPNQPEQSAQSTELQPQQQSLSLSNDSNYSLSTTTSNESMIAAQLDNTINNTDYQWLPNDSLGKNINNCIEQTYQNLTPVTKVGPESLAEPAALNNSMLPENVIKNQRQYTVDQHEIMKNVYDNVIQMEKIINYDNGCNNIYVDNDNDISSSHNNNKMEIKIFDKMEQQRLQELREKFQPLNQRPFERQQCIMNNIREGFQYLEHSIRQLILVIKNVKSFNNLCIEDQEILLRYSVSKIRGLLNMIRCYDREKESVKFPIDKGTMLVYDQDYLRKLHGDKNYEKCRNFCLSFHDEWKNDDTIVNLLIMIMVFYPNHPDLKHREYITLEYYIYCNLLLRHLEIKYQSISKAKSVYINLLSRLEEISKFNEEIIETILMKFDPQYFGSLTAELFDLKNKKI